MLFDFVAPTSVDGDNIGTMIVTKKTIAVSTPGRYYSVYVSTGNNNNDLTLSGGSTAINSIDSSWDGTDTSAPKAFASKGWGYAVPNTSSVLDDYS